ncbi:hypothetical protein BDV12DRAFT_173887 [Aspergillus spectabilis]
MKDLKSRLKQLTLGRKSREVEGPEHAKQPETVKQPEIAHDPEPDERDSEVYAELWDTVQQLANEKRHGSLVFTIRYPAASSPRISAHVHRYREENGSRLIHSTEYSDRGYIKAEHPSFELYRIQKKFLKRHSEEELDQEDYLLLDPEAYPVYEHENPGTVTVEGFGLDYWDAEIAFGRIARDPFPLALSDLPDISFEYAALLRRLDEIRSQTQVALDPEEQLAALTDCLGKQIWASTAGNLTNDRVVKLLCDLFRQQEDVSAWTTISESATRLINPSSAQAWSFLVSMVTAKELALRLSTQSEPSVTGLSVPILALLIITDLWLQNTTLEMAEYSRLKNDVLERQTAGVTEEEREKAAELLRQANEANDRKDLMAATALYQEAVSVNTSYYDPIQKRAEWVLTLSNYRGAVGEAAFLKVLDPTRSAGYAILGRSCMGYKSYARARDAFYQAAQLATTEDEKGTMLAEMAKAEAASTAELQAIEDATDEKEKRALIRSRKVIEWDPSGRAMKLLPTKYERQLEGLILFAERMKWPYLSEVRRSFENAYYDWLAGDKNILFEQLDWLYAVMRPGKHFAQILMTTLINSTPTLEKIGPALSQECGLVLPQCTYWRTRSVMGRVLGCVPGVTTLNGWIGPCPAVTLVSPANEAPPHHCLVTTLYFNPNRLLLSRPSSTDIDPLLDPKQNLHNLRQITEPTEWVTLDPPAQDNTTWALTLVKLEYWQRLDPNNPQSVQLWNAYLHFTQLESSTSLTFQLTYSPVFVTPPPCYHFGEETDHKIHRRELNKYKASEISIAQLHDFYSFIDRDVVIVINATAPGAEVVARAWCAMRQRSAVIRNRKAGGPCYACAVRAASKYGLRTGVLIWVS